MLLRIHRQNKPFVNGKVYLSFIFALYYNRTKEIPHNSKCRYDERGAAAAKPKAQIMLDAAKVSAASGGCSEPKQGQRSQSARGFCPRSTMRVPQPDIIEHFGNADAVPQPPERCLSRKAGIMRCCLRKRASYKRTGRALLGFASLAHLHCEGRLLRGHCPRERCPHEVGSWPSLQGLRGSAAWP